MRRLVAFSAGGHRGKKRAVGLDEQAIERHDPRYLLQLERARKRHDARQRKMKADVERALRHCAIAGETVKDAADVAGVLLREDAKRILCGFTRVDDDGQGATGRQPNLLAKDLPLHVARREIVVIVETDLAKAARQ